MNKQQLDFYSNLLHSDKYSNEFKMFIAKVRKEEKIKMINEKNARLHKSTTNVPNPKVDEFLNWEEENFVKYNPRPHGNIDLAKYEKYDREATTLKHNKMKKKDLIYSFIDERESSYIANTSDLEKNLSFLTLKTFKRSDNIDKRTRFNKSSTEKYIKGIGKINMQYFDNENLFPSLNINEGNKTNRMLNTNNLTNNANTLTSTINQATISNHNYINNSNNNANNNVITNDLNDFNQIEVNKTYSSTLDNNSNNTPISTPILKSVKTKFKWIPLSKQETYGTQSFLKTSTALANFINNAPETKKRVNFETEDNTYDKLDKHDRSGNKNNTFMINHNKSKFFNSSVSVEENKSNKSMNRRLANLVTDRSICYGLENIVRN